MMIILTQDHKRPYHMVEFEFNKIIESGHDYRSFGYINTNDLIRMTNIADLENERVYIRSSVQFLDSVVDGRFDSCPISDHIINTFDYDPVKFDVTTFEPHAKSINMMPSRHEFISLKDVISNVVSEDTFMKPINDRKLFDGVVVKKGDTLMNCITKGNIGSFEWLQKYYNCMVLVSTNIVGLDEEVRCFVVGGEAITASRYRKGGQPDITKFTHDEELFYLNHANKFINEYYAPTQNFTIDLALHSDDVSIIEYNCINTSGMYNINSKLLFDALESYYYED